MEQVKMLSNMDVPGGTPNLWVFDLIRRAMARFNLCNEYAFFEVQCIATVM